MRLKRLGNYPLYKELAFKQLTHLIYKINNPKRRYCPNCKGYLIKAYLIIPKEKFCRTIPIGYFCDKCECMFIITNIKSAV